MIIKRRDQPACACRGLWAWAVLVLAERLQGAEQVEPRVLAAARQAPALDRQARLVFGGAVLVSVLVAALISVPVAGAQP